MLPANVRVVSDFVITRDGQRARLQDFTREYVTIGDLTAGREITVEFSTVISRDMACGNEMINSAFAEAANHTKVRAEAKAQIECVTVAGAQQPLVRTGNGGIVLSTVLSLLAAAGYVYSRQRKELTKLVGRI